MLGEALGKQIEYAPIPLDAVRKNSVDMAMMLDWFDRFGYDADIAAVERQFDTRACSGLANGPKATLTSLRPLLPSTHRCR
jgi:hypothetical protein